MKKLFRFLCFVLVLSLTLGGICVIMSTNNSKDTLHIKGFFKEPDNTIDVLLIGASELYSGFCSTRAWSEYGYTSYALSYAGMPAQIYKQALMRALKTQKPKMIAFEVNGFLHGDKYDKNPGKIHAWFDNAGIDSDGEKFIKEKIPEDKQTEYFFPFYKYHSNWKKPDITLRNALGRLFLAIEPYSYCKAFATTNTTKKDNKIKNRKAVLEKRQKDELKELLDFCKDSGFKQVLFFRSPHCIKTTNFKVIEEVQQMVESYGYSFENFENSYDEIKLNTKTDFYNYEHMNVYGMEKFTKFLGEYIKNNYDVKTEHSKETVDMWNKCAVINEENIKRCKADNMHKFYYELSAFEIKNGFNKVIV